MKSFYDFLVQVSEDSKIYDDYLRVNSALRSGLEAVKKLVDGGAPVVNPNDPKDSGLVDGAMRNHGGIEMVKYLVDKGSPANGENIMTLISSGHNIMELLKYFLEDLRIPLPEDAHISVDYKNFGLIKYLMGKGMRPSVWSMGSAVAGGDPAVVEMLDKVVKLSDAARANEKYSPDEYGFFGIAGKSDDLKMLKYLASKGLKPQANLVEKLKGKKLMWDPNIVNYILSLR